jgi:stage II sporulation protein AA (anti-sigma F factor antagonist)
MNLKIVSEDSAAVCIACSGQIAFDRVSTANDQLVDLLGPDVYSKRVCLDLEGATFIDSAGVGWLIMCQKRFVERGGKLVLHSIAPIVAQVLQLLKLHTVLTLADNLEDAKKLKA